MLNFLLTVLLVVSQAPQVAPGAGAGRGIIAIPLLIIILGAIGSSIGWITGKAVKLWISIATILILLTTCQNNEKLLTVFQDKETDYTETMIGYDMVFVQGGTFTMGCTSEQSNDCDDGEKPAHEVTLDNFHIGRYEVTQKIWVSIMGANPSTFKGDSLPVDGVSWSSVHEFLTRLNEKTGKNYRLPTQAEWEYAARGGILSKGYKYSGSNNADEVAWYYGTAQMGKEVQMSFGKARQVISGTHPVGQKKPNELGIYDMSGNIGEWCSDFAGKYSSSPQTNPIIKHDYQNYPVYRGGFWGSNLHDIRVSDRGGNSNSGYDGVDVGFRLVHDMGSGKNTNKRSTSQKDPDKSFDDFIHAFCEDKKFQLSRVKFPVGNWMVTIDGPCPENNSNYEEFMGDCCRKTPMDKNNWKYLSLESLTPFKKDEGHHVGYWEKKTDTYAKFISGEGFEVVYFAIFEKKGEKWYLTEYFDYPSYGKNG